MFDKEDSFNPGGDMFEEPQEKSFQDIAGGMAGDAAGMAGRYAGIAGGYAGTAAGQGKEAVKKMIPLAIAGVIIVVIIIGLLWWMSQQQTIEIKINGLDAGALSSARLVVSGSDGKPIYTKSSSTHDVSLSPGTYTVKITATGYKTETMNLTTPYEEDGTRKDTLTFNLKKNILATLDAQFDYPAIYAGQRLEGTLIVTNTGPDVIDQEEIIVKDESNIKVTPDPTLSKFSVSSNEGNRTISIPFTVEVKGTITKTSPAKASLYIKGTTIKADINMSAVPTVPIDEISLSGLSQPYKNETLEAGKKVILTSIKITNKNKTIPLEDVYLTISPNPGQEYADRLDWFEFGSYEGQKYIYHIERIEPTESATIVLSVQPSQDAEVNDSFLGVFTISSLSMKTDINRDMTFTVKTKKTAALEFAPATSLKIECDQVLGTCLAVNNQKIGTLKNDGTEEIKNVTVEMDLTTSLSYEECAWLTVQTSSIQTIGPSNSTYDILANISPGFTDKTSILCYLKWRYTNPITNIQDGQRSDKGILITIDTK